MSKYYIYTDDVVRGPFTLENIAMMLSSGRISSDTQISTGKNTPWQTVGERPEIRAAAIQLQQPPAEKTASNDDEQIFYCQHCQQKYRGNSSWLGKDIVCINCHEIFQAANGNNTSSSTATAADPIENVNFQNYMPGLEDGDIICPNCWQRFHSEQLLYIASHPALTGDPVLGPGAMLRFTPTNFNALGQALDDMNCAATEVACPRCRLKIPMSIIDEVTHYFSIAGSQGSGKSYYLASLLNSLRKTMSNDFACTVVDVDPELNYVLDSYEETLFRSRHRNAVTVLPKTQLTGNDYVNMVMLDSIPVNLPKPFVYELKQLNSSSACKEDCNIVFYDNAGEHFQPGADNMINPGTRHLACSDGIIFIFDPINDANMRSICDQREPQLQSFDRIYDQSKLMSEMVARIRRHRNMDVDEKCSIPLVVAVSKYDSWQDNLSRDLRDLPLIDHPQSSLSGKLIKNTIVDVSFELRELLMQYVPELVNSAEGFFEQVLFVPFSSLGCFSTPHESGQLGVIPEQLSPIWVTAPFLSLLAENDWLETTSAAPAGLSLASQIIDDYILFTHPVSGKNIRLPWNYSQAVLTINGTRYSLPLHPKAMNRPGKCSFANNSSSDDMWV
ncbi:MAG: DUF4339 domain-containing protein [Lentisphaerae bacterium]|nr:DUF4339 domain-containing protein [Lentisphaerota bacterium]